jgi:hypothetical protein
VILAGLQYPAAPAISLVDVSKLFKICVPNACTDTIPINIISDTRREYSTREAPDWG